MQAILNGVSYSLRIQISIQIIIEQIRFIIAIRITQLVMYMIVLIQLLILCHNFRGGSKDSQFEKKFVPINNILSTTSNRFYKCIVPPASRYVNERSPNVLHLMTLSKFNLRPVEETSKILNKRFNQHNSSFRKCNGYLSCKFLDVLFSKSYNNESHRYCQCYRKK